MKYLYRIVLVVSLLFTIKLAYAHEYEVIQPETYVNTVTNRDGSVDFYTTTNSGGYQFSTQGGRIPAINEPGLNY